MSNVIYLQQKTGARIIEPQPRTYTRAELVASVYKHLEPQRWTPEEEAIIDARLAAAQKRWEDHLAEQTDAESARLLDRLRNPPAIPNGRSIDDQH